jgi:ankyrin repeat protein
MAPEPFAAAHRAVDAHDVDGLRRLLDEQPELVRAHGGANANDLLGMATATCDERLVALLLEHGADPAGANVHGWTALHQAAYVGLPALARILLDAGAPIAASARGDGGTPLVIALFWGHRRTAEGLAEHSTAPGNLRVAAGLGRVAAIEALFGHDGRLLPAAGAHRAFHRPHSGFPEWQPSDDPQEVLDEALAWAARNDRLDALDALVVRGARPDADAYRGTALAWAAACDRAAAIGRLVALGADPDARTNFGGPDHGEGATALHLAAGSGSLAAIHALLEAGADPGRTDALHGGTPAGWAEHGGHSEAAALLRPG